MARNVCLNLCTFRVRLNSIQRDSPKTRRVLFWLLFWLWILRWMRRREDDDRPKNIYVAERMWMPRTARREVETDSDQMLKELKTTKLVCSKLEFSKKKKRRTTQASTEETALGTFSCIFSTFIVRTLRSFRIRLFLPFGVCVCAPRSVSPRECVFVRQTKNESKVLLSRTDKLTPASVVTTQIARRERWWHNVVYQSRSSLAWCVKMCAAGMRVRLLFGKWIINFITTATNSTKLRS